MAVAKVSPPQPISAKPPRGKADGEVAREKQPSQKQQLPTRAEISRWINALHAELASDDRETVRQAERLCRQLAPTAAERLGLIIVGIQPGTVPQVTMASITVLKGAGVVGKNDPGATAEITE